MTTTITATFIATINSEPLFLVCRALNASWYVFRGAEFFIKKNLDGTCEAKFETSLNTLPVIEGLQERLNEIKQPFGGEQEAINYCARAIIDAQGGK